jgi:hypothetical protein
MRKPGQGLRLDPERSAGQEHDAQAAVQQIEQSSHFLNERVVATRVEEGLPIPPAPFEKMLAPGRI